ncbi:MAG: TIGR01841 family phasin [Alphaproteobacteria bacterium]|nr:TIGR01841 family phasin [Alphaproteobacteria bacterium]
MATKDNSSNFNFHTPFGADAFKFFQDFKNPGLEVNTLLESHRKNMQTIEAAQKAAAETLKELTQAQSQYARQTMEDLTGLMRHLMASGNNLQEKLELQSKSLKANVEKAVSHNHAISGILNQSQSKVVNLTNNRFNQYVDEMKNLVKKNAKKS